MAKKKKTNQQEMQPGDIVEVCDKKDAQFQVRGVVTEVGDTIRVAITTFRELKKRQIKMVGDSLISGMSLDELKSISWDELKDLAKRLDVPIKGTKESIQHEVRNAAIRGSSLAGVVHTMIDAPSATDCQFSVGDWVVWPRFNARGEVRGIDGAMAHVLFEGDTKPDAVPCKELQAC